MGCVSLDSTGLEDRDEFYRELEVNQVVETGSSSQAVNVSNWMTTDCLASPPEWALLGGFADRCELRDLPASAMSRHKVINHLTTALHRRRPKAIAVEKCRLPPLDVAMQSYSAISDGIISPARSSRPSAASGSCSGSVSVASCWPLSRGGGESGAASRMRQAWLQALRRCESSLCARNRSAASRPIYLPSSLGSA